MPIIERSNDIFFVSMGPEIFHLCQVKIVESQGELITATEDSYPAIDSSSDESVKECHQAKIEP